MTRRRRATTYLGYVVLFKGFQTGQERIDPTEYAAGATLLAMRFLTILWLGALSAHFFPSQYVVFATLFVASMLLILFHRRLGATYQWFERRFLSTFEVSPDRLHHLAPWDAHLVWVRVHPNVDIAGKQIRDTHLTILTRPPADKETISPRNGRWPVLFENLPVVLEKSQTNPMYKDIQQSTLFAKEESDEQYLSL